jgi:hypothetical protein
MKYKIGTKLMARCSITTATSIEGQVDTENGIEYLLDGFIGHYTAEQIDLYFRVVLSGATSTGCPRCGEESNLTGDSVELDGKEAWQEVTCHVCGKIFRNVYKLSFQEDI